jgi:hypothetical protein
MKIGEIDKNLNVKTSIGKENIVFLDPRNEPFEIYGFYKPKTEGYIRLPRDVAESVSEGVARLYRCTSG